MGLSLAGLVAARTFPAGSWSSIPGAFPAWLPRLAELSSGWLVVEIRELFETAFFGGHR
jgi:hypothetical protein